MYGGADVPLSTNGEAEARAAAAMIHVGVTDGVPLTHVFCSPLARAVYGAERVAEACGLRDALTPLEGLREVGRGEWYGLTPAEIMERYGEAASMSTFVAEPAFRPPGGESLEDVAARVLPARDAVLAALEPGAAAVVVSHLFVTRTVVQAALRAQGDAAAQPWSKCPPPSAVPELASCASSGRAWQPRAARHSQGGPRPVGSRLLPRVPSEPAPKSPISLPCVPLGHGHRRHRHSHCEHLVHRVRGRWTRGRPLALLRPQARGARRQQQRPDRGQLNHGG